MHGMQLLHGFEDHFENRWHSIEYGIIRRFIALKHVTNEEKCTGAFPDQRIY
jgi:hypothetical protein